VRYLGSFLIAVGLIGGCAKPRPQLIALDPSCSPVRIDSVTIAELRQAVADTTHFPALRALVADTTWAVALRAQLADTVRVAELQRLLADTAWLAEARQRITNLNPQEFQLPRCTRI
jgi:hypothetical protein